MIYVKQNRTQQPIHDTIETVCTIPPLNIAVAVDTGGGFSKDGKIPWHFSEDFKHFKETTTGSICIMGRKTYEDMLEMVKARQKKKKPITNILPGRTCYVLTRQKNYKAEGAIVANSLLGAIQSVEGDNRKIFVIGGEKIFIEALPWVETIYMTIIEDYYDCDRFFSIDYVKKNFTIKNGKLGENEKLKFITYKRSKK